MADLSAMYMDLAENVRNAPFQGASRMQQLMENQLAYQKAREDMEAQRGLRSLFAQSANPSVAEVGAISPAFAQEYQKNQQQMMKEQLGMQKTQAEIGKIGTEEHTAKAKIFANALGPLAEQFEGGGDPYQWKAAVGQALANIEQVYRIKPDVPFENFTPQQVLQAAEGLGYPSMRMKQRMAESEAYGSQAGRAQAPIQMTPEQAYGGVEMGAYGPKIKPPIPQAGRVPSAASSVPAPSITFEGKTYTGPEFSRAFMNETNPDRRALMNEYIDAAMASERQGIPNAQFVTPEQEAVFRIEEERQKKELESKAAGERKTAELGAESAEETAKKASTMATLPSDEEVYGLIKDSLQGEIEQAIKGSAASKKLGISSKANTATADLTAIQEQLRAVVKSLYTPGAITADEQKSMLKAIGSIAEAQDAESRIAGYRRFMNMARQSVSSHPELASEIEKITGNKILSPRRKIEVGHTVGNMRYKGGNPNDKNSWEEVR